MTRKIKQCLSLRCKNPVIYKFVKGRPRKYCDNCKLIMKRKVDNERKKDRRIREKINREFGSFMGSMSEEQVRSFSERIKSQKEELSWMYGISSLMGNENQKREFSKKEIRDICKEEIKNAK